VNIVSNQDRESRGFGLIRIYDRFKNITQLHTSMSSNKLIEGLVHSRLDLGSNWIQILMNKSFFDPNTRIVEICCGENATTAYALAVCLDNNYRVQFVDDDTERLNLLHKRYYNSFIEKLAQYFPDKTFPETDWIVSKYKQKHIEDSFTLKARFCTDDDIGGIVTEILDMKPEKVALLSSVVSLKKIEHQFDKTRFTSYPCTFFLDEAIQKKSPGYRLVIF